MHKHLKGNLSYVEVYDKERHEEISQHAKCLSCKQELEFTTPEPPWKSTEKDNSLICPA